MCRGKINRWWSAIGCCTRVPISWRLHDGWWLGESPVGRSLAMVAALATSLVCLTCVSAGAPTSILLVYTAPDHPAGTHMYAFECHLLAKCLRQHDGVSAEVTGNWPPEGRVLDEVHSVVFYSRPAGEIVLAPAHRRQWRSLMDRGVGFAAIHWGTGVGYGKLGDDRSVRAQYLADLGGWFRRPPGDVTVGRSRLHAPVEDHPVFRGWEPYEIRDEFYLRPQIHAQAQPLLRVDAAGGSHIVAWVMNRGGKPDHRSFGVTLGHFHDNFTDPRFRRLLVNGILWTAGYDVPEAGASVALGPQDTRLPEVGR